MAVSTINHIKNTKIQQNQQIPVNPRRCHWAELNCPFQDAGCRLRLAHSPGGEGTGSLRQQLPASSGGNQWINSPFNFAHNH